MREMKQFVEQFLSGGYNILMGVVGKLLEPGLGISRLSRSDFVNFFQIAGVCTGYLRMKEVPLPTSSLA